MHSLRRPNGSWWKSLSVSRLLAGNRLQASRPDETRSRTRNCQCAAYIRIARKGIHFMSYSIINSVPAPGITSRRLIKLRVCFQWTIRKAVAWSFRYKSWRTKYQTGRRLAPGVPCSASSGVVAERLDVTDDRSLNSQHSFEWSTRAHSIVVIDCQYALPQVERSSGVTPRAKMILGNSHRADEPL